MIERNYNNIPEELRNLKQWVCFKAEQVTKADGSIKYEKRLINPYTGKWAKINDPNDWAFYKNAKEQMKKYKCDGISLCLTDKEGKYLRNDIFCIDLDKVLEKPETLEFTHFESSKIYDMFKGKTYIEFSMSGTGLHIFGFGKLKRPCMFRKGQMEMYDSNRFMSVTGAKTPDSTNSLASLEKELRKANSDFIGLPKIQTETIVRGVASESDLELIQKIRNSRQGSKFSQLFDHGSTGDESADDFALCRILAFWTRNNEFQMDSIFRQSALMRPKWDKIHGSNMTYGQMTIRNAIAKSGVTRK